MEVIGKRVIYLGKPGMAATAKLAINYFLAINLQGLAETVLFATDNGIQAADMLEIINEGGLANGITKGKAGSILTNNFTATFALKHLVKDLRLADEQGIQSPLFPVAFQTFKQAVEQGLGDEDVMAVIQYLEQNRGTHPTVSNQYPEDNVSDYAN